MTIKNSGSELAFSEIEAEFGQPDNGRSLGRYRSSDSEFKNKSMGQLSNLPLDTASIVETSFATRRGLRAGKT